MNGSAGWFRSCASTYSNVSHLAIRERRWSWKRMKSRGELPRLPVLAGKSAIRMQKSETNSKPPMFPAEQAVRISKFGFRISADMPRNSAKLGYRSEEHTSELQ